MKNVNKSIFLFLTACFFSLFMQGQIVSQGTPPSALLDMKDELIPIEMPAFDVNAMLLEDQLTMETKAAPYRFAKSFDISLDASNSGTWENLPNGDRLWRLKLSSPGAYSLNVIFNDYNLPEGAAMYIYNDDRSFILGALTSINNKPDGVLATSLVPGDRITIEYYEPSNAGFQGTFRIGRLSHDYRGVLDKDGSFGQSGSCNVDINCPEGSAWQSEKRAVCRILMNGASLCSGALLNNTSGNGTPYFLTANHCTGEPYNTWVFYFNYESPSCGGPDGSTSQTISGSTLRATTSSSDPQNLDFCLVEMSSNPPANYSAYFAGWNRGSSAASNATGIHHPSGDVKKISKDYDSPVTGNYNSGTFGDNAHWQILEWDLGTTEGGSSGSPLFDQDHRVIGDLTGGQAACGNSVNDYYAKLSLSWDYYSTSSKQLKYWLDPASSGVTTLNGYDPNGGTTVACDFTNNTGSDDHLTYYSFGNKWGYWTGQNEYGWTKFADKYSGTYYHYVHGVNIPCAKASGSAMVTFRVWDDGSQPGTELASVNVMTDDFSVDAWNYLQFDPPVQTDGNFYIGYEVSYSSSTDTFAIYQVHDRISSGSNTAWIYDGSWKSCSSLGLSTSLGLDVRTCATEVSDGYVTKVQPMKIENMEPTGNFSTRAEFFVYPNPSSGNFSINCGDADAGKLNVTVYDSFGRPVYSAVHTPDEMKTVSIDLGSFETG
ncbi:MAG: trypsin-like peptidase domain-containing protein, partial [Bacteroidota bacterium]